MRMAMSVLVIGAAIACGVGGLAPEAGAQTDTTTVDLQRENDQLRQRVARLEAQLRESQKRIRVLEAQLASATDQGADGENTRGGGQNNTSEEAFAELPGDPMSCPAAIRSALVQSYHEQSFVGDSYDTRAEKTRYTREVQQWAKRMRRDISGPIDWTIRLLEVQEENSRTITLRFEVLDPVSGHAYGPATTASVARRMVFELVDAPAKSLWRITGKANAEPRMNPDRETSSEFDTTPLIGVFAEDGYEMYVKGVSEAAGP
jgi:hypothetical protein